MIAVGATTGAVTAPTDAAIRAAVVGWFCALDRHDDIDAVLPYLVDDGFELHVIEGTRRGHSGFREWYDAVTHRFFDETHTVVNVGIDRTDPLVTTLTVLVNWQARTWDPPAPYSHWLGFHACQTWHVVGGPGGRPQVRTYTVDRLEPMPGSSGL